MNKRFINIWAWPIVLALLTAFGLLAALLGSGLWHCLAWAAMAMPLIMIAYYWLINKTS